MFITTAYAQAAADAAPQSQTMEMLMQFLPILMIGVVFYLLMIRPQQTMQKKHQQRLNELKPGDEIVTGGGIIAKVKKLVDEAEIMVETEEGVKLRLLRSTISTVRDKPDVLTKKDKAA